MVKRKSQPFKIDSGQPRGVPVVGASSETRRGKRYCSVNLRYFQRSHECFSKWQHKELRAFSGFVEKMSQRTEADVTSVTQTCHAHKGTAKKLPSDVSPDVKMYSLDVGPKGRVHGFFMEGAFFLVWLDREGSVLGH